MSHDEARLLAAWTVLLLAASQILNAEPAVAAPPPLLGQPLPIPLEAHQKATGRGLRGTEALGSSPPSCRYKCGGCLPCAAVQVPAAAARARLQYANYEPEGWKCQCGSSFYNP